MGLLATGAAFFRLNRSQWHDRPQLAARQNARLRQLVDHAYRTVPFYRAHFDRVGIRPGDIHLVADLKALPPVSKAELRDAGADATVSTAFERASLNADHTSGSTASPFTVWREPHFVTVRKAQALRLLCTMGCRPGDRILSFIRVPKPAPAVWTGWRYLSIDAPPERLLAEIDAFRPAVIMGFTSTLLQLAWLIEARGPQLHRPRAIVNSGELFDQASRRRVGAAFGAAVFDAYAMTEMGVVAWECPAHQGLHVAEDTLIAELEPEPGTGSAKLVLTNLELKAMPFIRYATGDLVAVGGSDACTCGRHLMRLSQIEGRLVDSVLRPDGGAVSPYRFTVRLQQLPVQRYQLVQEELTRFRLRLAPALADETVAARARAMVREVAGAEADVEVDWVDDLDPPPSVKFRAVECRVGQRA